MWCYFCDDAKGGTLFPSSVTCIFLLFEHSKGSTFIRFSKRIVRISVFFFCLLFYTLYIYAGGRLVWLCPSWSRSTTPHTTRTREVAFEASWTLFASLSSPRENWEFVTRGWSGSEFLILRGCVIGECLGGFLFSSPRENRKFMEERAGGSEFSILRDCVFNSTMDASPCENRGFVDRDPRVHAAVPSAAGSLASESRFRGGVDRCDCSNYQLTKRPSWGGFYKVLCWLICWLLNIYIGERIIRA